MDDPDNFNGNFDESQLISNSNFLSDESLIYNEKSVNDNEFVDNSLKLNILQLNIMKEDFHSENQNKISNNDDDLSNSQIESTDFNMETHKVENESNQLPSTIQTYRINWTSSPKIICKAENIFSHLNNNYLRGCMWSPDGTCILTNSNDNILRVFELSQNVYKKELYKEDRETEMLPVLQMPDIDLIYDVCWYPYMNSNKPDTCFFASTSRKNAVRIWDAYSGNERARIQPRDHMDEPISAQSLAFSRDGVNLYCGFDKCIRVYDVTRLGSNPERRPKLGSKSELRGIISCIATSPVNIGMYACGSYSKDAAIFHENSRHEIMEFLRADERVGGITHIEFSPVDMNCVVTGSRIDNALHVWDLRNLGSPLYATAKRNVQTNQRIYFSFDPAGNYIMSGNHDGKISVFSINGGHIVVDNECILPKIAEWQAHNDVCNGLSLHPYLSLLATSSGQRRILPPWRRKGMLNSTNSFSKCSEDDSDEWSTDEENDKMFGAGENQLKIWSYPVINEHLNKDN